MNLLKILDGTPEPPIIDLELKKINETGDYHLATPMYEFQKELTDQIVSLHYPDILKYCETNDTKELIVKSLEICINNCMLVSTHPYLLINHYMPKNLTMKDMPKKLADTSGKFNVLKDLINVILTSSPTKARNVGIIMKNDSRFFDLVEALLLGCTGNKIIKRYVGHNVQKESKKQKTNNIERSTIHLLPCDGNLNRDEDVLSSTKFDVLIVFDGYVDTKHSFVQKIRTQNRRGDAIIIRLVPMKTIEHCKIFYDKEEDNYLYKLISSIVCLREFIGNILPDVFPIYNQKLTYLSSKFFDHLFRARCQTFPSWPLPELPPIPRFTSIDVERSLLTEVHFHYTPYDTSDFIEKPKTKVQKRSYYEMKRLELDYVSNPLKNDMNSLIGIHLYDHASPSVLTSNILTHKLVMELNNAYTDLSKVEQEVNGYKSFNSESQAKVGRREEDVQKSLSQINDDINHVESRINLANRLMLKKEEEGKNLQQEIHDLEAKLKTVNDDYPLEQDQSQFVKNQSEIWNSRDKVTEFIRRIKSKNEECSYMSKEYKNCLESITESEKQIDITKDLILQNREKSDVVSGEGIQEEKKFEQQKQSIIDEIKTEKSRNEALMMKLSTTLKFLKDTSHLKKRKGRGLTPNSK